MPAVPGAVPVLERKACMNASKSASLAFASAPGQSLCQKPHAAAIMAAQYDGLQGLCYPGFKKCRFFLRVGRVGFRPLGHVWGRGGYSIRWPKHEVFSYRNSLIQPLGNGAHATRRRRVTPAPPLRYRCCAGQPGPAPWVAVYTA